MHEDISPRSMSPEELRRITRIMGYQTQQQLADAIGVSRSSVSLWMEGKVGVPRPIAMLLRMLSEARHRSYADGSGMFTPLARRMEHQ